MKRRAALSIAFVLTLAAAAAPAALAQFGNAWAEFQNEDARIVAAPDRGLADVEEKDYATGDFDKDGWTDLVVVRKSGWHTTGRRTNVLFMNESGMLVDRTLEYASASDVPLDMGFLTPTNDRDVVVTDVNQDTWPDIVTATTLSPGQPKHVSHPRVYVNLGEDVNDDWLGFRHEDARIPQLLVGAAPTFPRFTAVDAGDLTGDGFPDLYFGDNDDAPANGGLDVNDRLLINDGAGSFVDETTLRLTGAMQATGYTTGVVIADVNKDDVTDVVRDRGLGQQISVIYNDVDNEGFFDSLQTVSLGQPYYVDLGDLNRDDWPDLLVSHNSTDRVVYSQGLDGAGEVDWSDAVLVEYVTGSDDGFAGDNYVVDLDGDGWNDAVYTDVDPQIPGCSRRTHIFHNPGGVIGAQIVLREEAEQAVGGWRGVVGLLEADLQSVHDAAIFDVNNDGMPDMVFGRCTGTSVWINLTVPPVPGGSTPDGSDGAALAVRRLPGGTLRLTWGPSCSGADYDYAVYSGTLGDYGSLTPVTCSTSGARFAGVPGPAGDVFFLVVPNDRKIEGSYGLGVGGAERAASASACWPQSISTCP